MLSRATQIQVVADMVAGVKPAARLRVSEFEDPFDICYEALMRAWPGDVRPAPAEATKAVSEALGNRSDKDSVMKAIIEAKGSGLSRLPSFAALIPSIETATYLWPKWIPLGMLTLLGAAPGAGKTFVALDLARRVINGEPWPDGAAMGAEYAGRNVVYVDAECAPQMLKARLMAWRFDYDKLFLMQPDGNRMIDLSWRERNEDRDRLILAITAHNPALVIVDSFSMVSSRGENNVEDVRDIMGWLAGLARDYGCAVALVHHLRKRSLLSFAEALSQDDFRGSTHVTAAPRSVLGLSLVQSDGKADRNGPRKLELVKTNLGSYPDALKLTFVSLAGEQSAGDAGMAGDCAARLEYEPLVEPQGAAPGLPLAGRAHKCAAWLLETLQSAGEPLTPKEVVEMADDAGFTRWMVFKAREALGGQIADTHGRRSPRNRWTLPQQLAV